MTGSAKRGWVPKLRFPEFREAGGWSKEKLGAVATLYKGKGISKAEIVANGVQPCIRYGELYTIYGETIRETVSSTNVDASELFLSKKNDVIIPASGETKIDIAKASCVMSDDIALGGDLNVIRSSQNGVFLSYQLNGPLRFSIAKVAQGDTVVHLYPTQIERLDVLVPSPIEQQKIADCLASLDELLTLEAKKLDTLKTHKKGLMQQLFPAEGETLPKLRFPEFREAGEWDERELGPLTTKVGSGITPTGGDKNYKTKGRPFVRSQNVGWGELILNDVAFIDEETHQSFDSTEIKVSDVLLNITGASIGRSAVADSRIVGGNVNQHVCIIRAKQDELNPALLNHFLISERGQKQIDSFQAGGNRQGLNFAQIRTFVIPLPPTEHEQRRIADCLASLDDHITAQTKKLTALKTHKKGLMQQLFPVLDEATA
jgi:type I restriction enzyme S subunit